MSTEARELRNAVTVWRDQLLVKVPAFNDAAVADIAARRIAIDNICPLNRADCDQATTDVTALIRAALEWGIECGVHPENVIGEGVGYFDPFVIPWEG